MNQVSGGRWLRVLLMDVVRIVAVIVGAWVALAVLGWVLHKNL